MTIYTEGIPGGLGVRLEIREFAQNRDLLNIFLLGLSRMHSVASTDSLSWFQISGIHGRPFRAWDDVSGKGNRAHGYCTHASILFPSWHRPYLALLEQVVYANMQESVADFPPGPIRSRYDRILPKFRFPYFDMALNQPLPDILLSLEEVDVILPTGKGRIANPLFSYHFSTPDQMEHAQARFEHWNRTLRYPSDLLPNAHSRPDFLKRALGNSTKSLGERTYQLFSIEGFRFFAANVGGSAHSSLEGVHNTGHGLTGGGGNMSFVPHAAFDPIFWLHHCNIDRLFAMWQVLHPNSYVEDLPSTNPTFWSEQGSIETSTTPLHPFRMDGSKMWNSQTVQDLKVFKSIYPELIDLGGGPDKVKTNVREAIRRLYGRPRYARMVGGFAPRALQSKIGIVEQRPTNPVVKTNPAVAPVVLEASEDYQTADANAHHNYYEYFANFYVEKYALGGTFSVYVFIGDFTEDSYGQIVDRNLVGTFDIFVSDPETTECEKCKDDSAEHLIVKDSIPLTGSLLDHIDDDTIPGLGSLNPEVVTPFLKRHLHWRIHLPDGSEVPRENVPSLKVYVTSVIVDVPDDESELPQYGTPKPIYEVTAGRPCGLEEGEEL